MAINPVNGQQGEHVNTFQNGMNQDSNVVYQPDGTYRYARNLQLINHDGNNFTLKDSLGNRKVFQLPQTWLNGNPTYVTERARMPIGFISFADGEQQLVVFSTHTNASGGEYGEIGLLSLTNISESVDSEPYSVTGLNPYFYGYLPLYGHDDLKFSQMYKVEGFAYAENDNVRRVYWTDYFNEPRVLDIANPIFTTYFTSGSATNPLVLGKQYMVLNGIINYNGVEYGVGIGNVFTATATTIWTDVTTALGIPYPPLVIEYYDVTLLDWAPDVSLGDMYFDSYGTGSCNCGNRMYFHRLIDSASGVTTSWSYGMFPVYVGLDQNPIPIINSQHYSVGAGSSTTLVSSIRSVKVRITNIDTKFDTIQLACAEFDQQLEVPTSIQIVVNTPITTNEMTLEDFGNINLGTLTLDDITLFPANILKCKTLTTNKNYNVIANIVEREELDGFDPTSVVLTDYTFQMSADNEGYTSCANTITFGSSTANAINPSVGVNPSTTLGIRQSTRWVVTVGTVRYPAVGGTLYTVGEVFQGDSLLGAGYRDWAQVTVGAQIRPANFMQQYEPLNNTSQRYDVQEIKSFTGWDYRNPLVASMSKGYRSSEKYRFGVLFHDKKRNPFYVRWIADHTFQSLYDKDGLLKEYDGIGDAWYVLQANILNVSGLRIPKDIVDKIDGFSIVRAICDPTIITQGLCWQTQYNGTVSPPVISPLPSVVLVDGNGWAADPQDHVYSFICPDDLLGEEFTSSKLMSVGDTMRVVGWLSPSALSSGGYYYKLTSWSANVAGKKEWATKLYQHVDATNTSYNNESTVVTFARFNENDTSSNFVSGNDFYNKDMWTGLGGGGYTIDAACISAGIINANNTTLVGSKKIAVKTLADFSAYNQAAGYSDTAAANGTVPFKCLVNYIIPNANQYGGTGEAALAATTYISTGHYQQIDAQVIADNCDTGIITAYTYLEFNNIQVGGGDTFVCIIDQGYGVYNSGYADSGSYGIMFPCETRVNFNLRRGRKTSDFGMHQESNGVSYVPVSLEDYSYNNGYCSEGDAILYPALPLNFSGTTRFPYRVRWAGQKLSGEQTDSFRVFLTNDYRDADGKYGEINNVRPKGDYVYYWQNKSVGSVPIQERQMISGSAGAATQLGTGGVITRFDTIDTKYGNQHQHGLTETIEGWMWFDMRNKTMCVMNFNGGVAEISYPTGMKSFFSEVFKERLSSLYSGTYLNSQTSDISSDRPLIGTGIVGVYDPKNQMTYMTFKFSSYYKENDDPEDYTQYQILNKDFTIGYSHVLNKFVGFYDKMPAIWHNHNQSVLSANNPKNINIYYAADMVFPTPISIGDVIFYDDTEYIAYADGILTSWSPFPNSNIFTAINFTNGIYVENEEDFNVSINPQGYLYNELYGRVVDNELEIVVSPKQGQMSVTNAEMGAVGDNFTELTISAGDNQTATDLNIDSTNRDYRYFDGSWWFNLPNSLKGRITDKYLSMRIKKKNYDTDPTVNNDKLTIIEYIKSFFENKR